MNYLDKPLIKKDHKPVYETICGGLRVEIEYPVGSYKVWRHEYEVGVTKYENPYGYILDTKASDGDSVDCYLGPYEDFTEVYIIRQLKPDTGIYDEPKTCLAFANAEDAKRVYLKHMGNKIEFFGGIKTVPLSIFKRILQESNYENILVKARLSEL
jgi:hypothetical protein